MARVLVSMGITKIRLTGGEPLLRRGVVDFVRELAQLNPPGLKPKSFKERNGTAEAMPSRETSGGQDLPQMAEAVPFHDANRATGTSGVASSGHGFADEESLDIAMTTNGHLLADMAQPLKDAGLNRITVSMDAVDSDRFTRIDAGLWPVKVNCVLMRGFNEDQIIPFGMFAREEGVTVRFIEFMPLEEDRVWAPETVVMLDEILRRMAEYRPLIEIPHARSETARRYRFDDGIGEIGIIAPVSHPFCGHCSRIRITSDGKIRTCLFSVWDHDLHELMRRGASDEDMAEFIRGVIARKEERHHIGEPDFVPASRTMVHIGG